MLNMKILNNRINPICNAILGFLHAWKLEDKNDSWKFANFL